MAFVVLTATDITTFFGLGYAAGLLFWAVGAAFEAMAAAGRIATTE